MEAYKIHYQNGVYIKEKVVKVINNQKKKLSQKIFVIRYLCLLAFYLFAQKFDLTTFISLKRSSGVS